MSLKPREPQPIPPEIAAWGARHLPPASPYRFLGDMIFALYRDEDFADLYHREGRPAVSPVLLSFVLVLQALDNESDRGAADAVESNLKWKYALHLPLDYDSFDFSILCDFRDRLIAHHAEARIFDTILSHLKALGLLTPRGIQRTDSLSVHTKARPLARIELMTDTIRVVVRALLRTDADWTRATVPAAWDARYGKRLSLERMDKAEIDALAVLTGDDGQWLLDQIDAAATPKAIKSHIVVRLLRTIWAQHYTRGDDGHMQWLSAKGYDGTSRIQTCHDPEARWSQHRDQSWTGYKLQLSETDDDDQPHLITDIAVTSAITTDYEALPQILERQDARDALPRERYVDRGYMSATNITRSAAHEEDLRGFVHTGWAPQARAGGFTHADFTLDWERMLVHCPAGQTTTVYAAGDSHQAVFRRAVCAGCPFQARCVTGATKGRTLRFGPEYQTLLAARERQQEPAFKASYNQHRGGVEGSLSIVVHQHGARLARYAGVVKNHLRALCMGVAVNLARGAAWLAGLRPKKLKTGLGLVPTAP